MESSFATTREATLGGLGFWRLKAITCVLSFADKGNCRDCSSHITILIDVLPRAALSKIYASSRLLMYSKILREAFVFLAKCFWIFGWLGFDPRFW